MSSSAACGGCSRTSGSHPRRERRFKLPPEADLDHVEAKFHTGVLEVHVPKMEPAKARKIEIGNA